jgi:hypothetical protein
VRSCRPQTSRSKLKPHRIFSQPDCKFDAINQFVKELFSDQEEELGSEGIQSVQCFEVAGTVNGFTAGSPEDIEQEAIDFAAANGEEFTPPPRTRFRRLPRSRDWPTPTESR